ncbi:SDR family NAD(P)-dependent oxidoreductase [Actinomadura rugatobispora]|uniref:SDR family NAD(P)-dependent oxidoreductase n=1 Tax=Actinomadura rugatobispora TaxID=1994 RepID=A0ABW0ZW56_9ACTN|nr:SDR family oxidoreductase [Actinomadura rugatobispora]
MTSSRQDASRRGATLITGCGSGIGAATAVTLAAAGHRVVASVHSFHRMSELAERSAEAGVELDVRELDVTDAAATAACVADVAAAYGSLRAVVSNAGVNRFDTFERETPEDYRRLFEVNVFGPVALIRQAMPFLRASGGRVVAVGSIGGVVGLPFQHAYSGSKFALEGVLESLAPVARRLGVAVSVVEPGPTATGLGGIGDRERLDAESGPYREALRQYTANAARVLPGLPSRQPADAVAAVIRDVLAARDPDFRYATSPAGAAFLARKLPDVSGRATADLIESWLEAPAEPRGTQFSRNANPPNRPGSGPIT